MTGAAHPRFAVVIPTYERGDLVVESVESVLAQTLDDREIVVVDDGSSDDTRARLAPFAGRVRYVFQQNAGPAAARNRGIAETTAPLVGFLDSDDRWEAGALERVDREFRLHPDAGLISVMARETAPDGTPTARVYGKRSAGPWYTPAGLLDRDAGGCSWFFVRRQALDIAGGFDETLRSAEECDLVLRLAFLTRLRAVREPLLLRRKHAGNLSHDVRLNAECWLRILDKLAAQQPGFVRDHPRSYRRSLAKERLRLGRELLAHDAADPASLARARRLLRASIATHPRIPRAWLYLAWSWLTPTTFGPWRGG